MWIKAFDWMRVFKQPAFFYLLIKYTLYDMQSFLVLIAIVIFLFTNCLYVLNVADRTFYPAYGGSNSDYTALYPDEPGQGNSFLAAFWHVYITSLGEYDTESYGNRGTMNTYVVWILFFLATFFIQITFMNMLIAIMQNTFVKVMAKRQ